ncbi:hypothetical protein [Streptomyces sp. NPDC002758]
MIEDLETGRWVAELEDLFLRVGGRFSRVELRRAAAQLPAIDFFDGAEPTHRRWVLARRSNSAALRRLSL